MASISPGSATGLAQAVGVASIWAKQEGAPYPLGVSWLPEEAAYNFALYSKYATQVTLLLYTETDTVNPVIRLTLDPFKNKSGRVWHCRLAETALNGACYYAYAINGPAPTGRFEWHNFDPQKVLLDPYARTVVFPPGFDRHACSQPGSTAGKAPLGLICKDQARQTDGAYDWGNDRHPRHESDAVIYEMHVRGFTMHPTAGIPVAKQGTFAGVVEKIPYLKDLGVTVLELMPIFQCDPQEGSVWGYMPLNFFSPHATLASATNPEQIRNEFRDMIKALHAADIEVILDVVYNHTCENDTGGPNYSYKGIDNSTYYMISENLPAEPYANHAGTGNTLHCANHAVRKLILDSMRYWVKEMHVDGFRFDLASILSRNSDGSMNTENPPIFSEIASDPDLATVRLIAEPWDASGGYLLGVNKLQQAFPGITWLQWNDQYRMDLQRFGKSDPDHIGRMMARLYGSNDLFPDSPFFAYRPYQSVNYVNSHDGFSLYDQVAYNNKVNLFDGSTPISWNCGWEGDNGVPPEVMNLRRQQAKNFAALLFLSNGTPMFRAGDEFLQTQNGHNNPYNIDELNWLDWGRLQSNADHYRFFKHLIAFRKAHPTLCRSRFWREDIRWYGANGEPDLTYESRTLAFRLSGASVNDNDLYVMINAWWQPLQFTVQENNQASPWKRVLDTSLSSPEDIVEPGQEVALNANNYTLAPRSVVVLMR
jgi:isoamylase